MKSIPDHIRKDLHILFVGFNPSLLSSETGHHFANPRNRFWTILYKAGLTQRKYKPEEDYLLLNEGYGLTNIVERPSKEASEIFREEYKEGKEILKLKLVTFKPKVVCFVGKGVYLQYSGKKRAPWGLQIESITEGVKEFVAPSSSGLVRMPIEEIISIYSNLNKIKNSL
jgi:double-stranded uracil-DNA glycosylase